MSTHIQLKYQQWTRKTLFGNTAMTQQWRQRQQQQQQKNHFNSKFSRTSPISYSSMDSERAWPLIECGTAQQSNGNQRQRQRRAKSSSENHLSNNKIQEKEKKTTNQIHANFVSCAVLCYAVCCVLRCAPLCCPCPYFLPSL